MFCRAVGKEVAALRLAVFLIPLFLRRALAHIVRWVKAGGIYEWRQTSPG